MLDTIAELFTSQTESEKQIEDLKAMDDHELADIGISRDQIEAFVAEHVSH